MVSSAEIDTAAAQDEIAECDRDQRNAHQCSQYRQHHGTWRELTLHYAGEVGAKSEPGAMAERDQARVADENVECHAGHGEDDDLGRRRDAETDPVEREWQCHQRSRCDQQG